MKRSLILHMALLATFSLSNAMEEPTQKTSEIETQKEEKLKKIEQLKKKFEQYRYMHPSVNIHENAWLYVEMNLLINELRRNGLNKEADVIERILVLSPH